MKINEKFSNNHLIFFINHGLSQSFGQFKEIRNSGESTLTTLVDSDRMTYLLSNNECVI